MKVVVKKLLRAGMMPARTWGADAVEMSLTAAAVKKSTTCLSLFMEAYGPEVEEELSSMATQCWAGGVWMGKWRHSKKKRG